MKNIIITLALLSISTPVIAQVNRTAGDRVSNLGTVPARSNEEASRLCRAKGGNIVVHNTNGTYTCFYAERLAK
tara:strand:+ start:550 stop:771 length:222 start_codon:yes stop_codon:yes gene_type:complete